MRPPIKGDGPRRPVLEWEHNPKHGEYPEMWTAYCMGTPMQVTAYPAGFYWWCGAETEDHVESTLIDAQLAAESAARDLLCEALAAFADGAPSDFGVVRTSHRSHHNGGSVICVQSRHVDEDGWKTLSHDDARRLALALLRAAGTKEGTP